MTLTESKILLVEDEALLRMSLELNLTRRGIKVITAKNGTEALALLQQHPCELLITDYLMEGLTGIELLQQARQQFPDIKVIVLSGYADEGIKEKILQAGANMFLWKPVAMEALFEAIKEVLKR